MPRDQSSTPPQEAPMLPGGERGRVSQRQNQGEEMRYKVLISGPGGSLPIIIGYEEMSNKKRERTARYRLTVVDRIACGIAEEAVTKAVQRREVVENHNFRNLVAQGVIVEERT